MSVLFNYIWALCFHIMFMYHVIIYTHNYGYTHDKYSGMIDIPLSIWNLFYIAMLLTIYANISSIKKSGIDKQ